MPFVQPFCEFNAKFAGVRIGSDDIRRLWSRFPRLDVRKSGCVAKKVSKRSFSSGFIGGVSVLAPFIKQFPGLRRFFVPSQMPRHEISHHPHRRRTDSDHFNDFFIRV